MLDQEKTRGNLVPAYYEIIQFTHGSIISFDSSDSDDILNVSDLELNIFYTF